MTKRKLHFRSPIRFIGSAPIEVELLLLANPVSGELGSSKPGEARWSMKKRAKEVTSKSST